VVSFDPDAFYLGKTLRFASFCVKMNERGSAVSISSRVSSFQEKQADDIENGDLAHADDINQKKPLRSEISVPEKSHSNLQESLSREDDLDQYSNSNNQGPVATTIPSHHSKRSQKETEDDPFEVSIPEDSPEHPYNWPLVSKKLPTVAQLSLLALTGSAASSIMAPTQTVIAQEFGIAEEVTVLTVSLYVLAFALGPLIWAPVSEMYGRRWSLVPAMFGMGFFSIGAALSPNAQTLLVMRFFTGLFGSAPVSNVSAALGDMFAPKTRGTAMAMYSVVVVGGPTLFPTVAAAITVNKHLGWRWTQWLQVILAFASGIISLFFLPEMYRPYLLKLKAAKMRKETGDERYHSPFEQVKLSFKTVLTKHLARPMYMLFTEPICTFVAFYASFVYSLLYMTLEVFPIVFRQNRGWGPVVSTTPFLSLFAGVLIGVNASILNQPYYERELKKSGGKPVPEARCRPMALGAFFFVIGLWWFGWTANPNIPWPVPVVGAAFIGAGFNILFLQSIAGKFAQCCVHRGY
jgi:MFS family permease